MVEGFAAPGFERVRDEFVRNFEERGELGAACAVYRGDEKLVDLWGGWRDAERTRRWGEDTLVMVYSTTKGLSAMTLALLHARGRLDYDERVAAYWPEFAQHGKQGVTVRQLLAHQAGLCTVDEPLDAELVADLDRLAAIMARQRPAWSPGSRHGYHASSIGWYEQELVRRTDPAGRSLGRFFAEEIAAPLGVEFYIGLPPEVGRDRLARVKEYGALELALRVGELPRETMRAFARRGSLARRAYRNPYVRSLGALDDPSWHRVEYPAGTGVGQARAIARAYAAFASGGRPLGLGEPTAAELRAPARSPAGGDRDAVLKVPAAYSLGFLKPSRQFPFSPSPGAFGHHGAGGSFGFGDPDTGIGYAYVMNRLRLHLHDDPRERALRTATYRCLRARAEAPDGGRPSRAVRHG